MSVPASSARSLTITNPLHLYRSLVALKRIETNPGQHRLAIYLQDLYHRLKDYEPAVDYSQKLNQLSKTLESSQTRKTPSSIPIWQKSDAKSRALVRSLTSHEGALEIQSPRGLLLHGEVGTGKSMLIDLLADSLPNRKKRRWHFNTFMLEVLTNIEKLRIKRLAASISGSDVDQETPLLAISRDLVLESPILFLDEFQLPDKAASKILTHLFTCFFQLGGVLIATSNRMPEELDKASGIEFVPPAPASTFSNLRDTLFGRSTLSIERPQQSDFQKFLEVLRARCEVWEIEGKQDWRRRESGTRAPGETKELTDTLPKHYLVDAMEDYRQDVLQTLPAASSSFDRIPWQTKTIRVYGRDLIVPRCLDGVTMWTFKEICFARLGPADYVSLASTFHTFIIQDVPVLHILQRSEARRFITLLDALYEARAKLLIQAEAGPDDIFFPEQQKDNTDQHGYGRNESPDGTYAETFSEIYQDQTAPFRPNISSYASTVESDYSPRPLPTAQSGPPLSQEDLSRSLLADEDADFGPVYGAGRSSANSEISRFDAFHRTVTKSPTQTTSAPNFQKSTIFTGEDERFAYKRAQSRLWEMCSQRWWDRHGEEGWWKPIARGARTWEKDDVTAVAFTVPPIEANSLPIETKAGDQVGLQEDIATDSASPFRVSPDPPPKFSWVHAWGMVRWGSRAGAWGQGAEKFDPSSSATISSELTRGEQDKASKRDKM